MSDTAIEVVNLSKDFGRTKAISNVTFRVKRGESILFFGPNGSGKTTTFLNIVGIERPTSGKVLILDKDPFRYPEVLEKVSLLTHDLWLYEDLTGIENLRYYQRLFGKSGEFDENFWIERFGFGPALSRTVRTYSYGMKKRLALIRTFSRDADIFMLDEPFGGLDVKGEEVLKETFSILKKLGKTIIFTTHLFEMGLPLAERVILIEKGVIKFDKKSTEIKEKEEEVPN